MLIRTFFVICLIAVLSEAIVYGAASLARAELHHRALEGARAALQGGMQNAQALVASDVRAGNGGTTWTPPQPAATCAATRSDGTCALQAAVAIAPATPPPSAGAGCASGTNCTIFSQANDAVAERRAYADVTATISDASGTTLATRSSLVAFRIFDQAPYATVAGALDSSATATNGAISDDAGSTSSGTLVHVQYRDQNSGTTTSGDVWSASTQNYNGSPTGW